MGTASLALILACRLQAWFGVRGLNVTRVEPAAVFAGDEATLHFKVSSIHTYKRPLINIVEQFPEDLAFDDLSPSLPVAPTFDRPVLTQYRFRPLHRGSYRLNTVEIQGMDALGLVRINRRLDTEPVKLRVMPLPLPFDVKLPRGAGWGLAESEYGKSKGSGIEPRGVREYTEGDSERFIHWKSTARAGRLLVKEFETGAYSQAFVFIQRSHLATNIEQSPTLFDRICGHAAYLVDMLLRNGSDVVLPTFESGSPQHSNPDRKHQVLLLLAEIDRVSSDTIEEEVVSSLSRIVHGSSIYIFLSNPHAEMSAVIRRIVSLGAVVNLLIYRQDGEQEQSDVFDLLQQSGATLQFMP
jgi:uncharacterized protein (DUF58 family)